ncbi:MAG TPA: NfeD family protein [Planctomycetota bacterium]|nr:NfeD family protein [Planctomycetota bacterium]
MAAVCAAEGRPRPAKPLIYLVEMHGEINRAMMAFIQRGIKDAKNDKADCVIFDIDTFGGRVDSAMEITTLIGSVDPALSVAYVTADPGATGAAWSAGALISFSCKKIYMAAGTSIGAAAPVLQTEAGMEMASEKVVSAVRGSVKALAEKNKYPTEIALAMVDSDIELWEVVIDGKVRTVMAEEHEKLQAEANRMNEPIDSKLISAKGKLLTLTAEEAEKYGVSSGTLSREALPEALRLAGAEMKVVKKTFFDEMVGLLTAPVVVTLLVVIGLVALYIEITTPGFGVPGTVGVLCFLTIFTSNFLLGRVGSVEIVLFVLGLALLVVEVFLIPGFGVAGVAGIVLIMSSLVLAMQGFAVPEFSFQWDIMMQNILVVMAGFIAALIIVIVLLKYLRQVPLLNRLELRTEQLPEQGYVVQSQDEAKELFGRQGVALTKLRPVGKAEFGERLITVETDGEFLEAGSRVQVIEVSGNRVLVRKV